MHDEWLKRWEAGNTGWHEQDGNAFLKKYWPKDGNVERVLVPLCGKSPDLLWLAGQGHTVIGAEISELAVRGFFTDHGLAYSTETAGELVRYVASTLPITIFCGDYFSLSIPSCDGLYDRGSLIALPAAKRAEYVQQTKALLDKRSTRLIVTVEYDQTIVDGPPFSIREGELKEYWPDLRKCDEQEAIASGPPKFREAGLTEMSETVWLGR